jgi:hypothetical protein
MTEKMAAAKMAKRCQAWLVSPDGIGVNQRPSASANVTTRPSSVRRRESGAVTDTAAATDAGALTDPELPRPAPSHVL